MIAELRHVSAESASLRRLHLVILKTNQHKGTRRTSQAWVNSANRRIRAMRQIEESLVFDRPAGGTLPDAGKIDTTKETHGEDQETRR